MKKYLNVLLLSTLAFLTSCVGTIKETSSQITNIGSNHMENISFAGLHLVSPIADTKAELFFYPAGGGSGKYIYDIYVGNAPNPISVPSDILTPDYRGLLRYTVPGLSRMSQNQFKIEARDQMSNGFTNTGVIKTASTFPNRVCDFNGIGSVSNMPGQDGKDSIMVRYTTATTSGSLTPQEWDPIRYEMIVVDAEKLTPADMDLNLTTGDGLWVFSWNHANNMNQYIARGLLPNRKYYARIRCIHKNSTADVYTPNLRSELNTRYAEISTLSDNLADIQFDGSSFEVSLVNGSLGLTTVQTTWSQAAGVFDHFRLYYSKAGGGVSTGPLPEICLSEALSPPTATIFCKKIPYDATSSLIAGLEPYASYEFQLAVCQTNSCTATPLQRILGQVREITMDPATLFNGIKTIEASTHINGSEIITLTYEDPSQVGGYFDGLILKMRRTNDGSDAEVEITDATFPISYRTFDPMNSTTVIIEGISYLSADPYCFRLYPYKWNEDRSERREIVNENWRCVNPKIEPPTSSSFPGITTGTTTGEYVTLNWNPPEHGFYTNYVLFWKKNSASLNWGDALSSFNTGDTSQYNYIMLESDETTITLQGFESGSHIFGVLTYHLYLSEDSIVERWSETNGGFKRCIVDQTSSTTNNCF